ncbi:MAG: GntR family transcriptional regulator [Clostridia bacterium]|nr:GntR family transcriptional regulator [Clostridia bacterium]
MNLESQTSMPIYEKVADDFRNQIIKGILKPDDKMPSVRQLALTLRVNPNTIQKAYELLEREGYIYVVIGKGNFVANNLQDAKKEARTAATKKLKDNVLTLLDLGMKKDEIIEEIKKIGGTK